MKADRGFITGMGLKRIAAFTMLIDHVAATLLERYILAQQPGNAVVNICEPLGKLYIIMRGIGRIAFPIYCFLLVEGFMHTKSLAKYIKNLFIFALISEIPFDMAVRGSFFAFDYQNVNFTLLLGLLAIILIDCFTQSGQFDKWLGGLLAILSGVGFMWVAELLHTDYGFMGVLAIIVMYLLRKRRVSSIGFGVVSLAIFNAFEAVALLDILPVSLYNGERGRGSKYFHYAFYPVHLFVLGCLCMILF